MNGEEGNECNVQLRVNLLEKYVSESRAKVDLER